MSNDTVLNQDIDEELDINFYLEDGRDRRAVDEEDDEDFLQELDLLTQQVKKEYASARARYERNHGIP